jgi:cobyrinic acid a,c-diamide synthase
VETFALPRVVIAGLSGGAGKTLVSVGLARAWARRGLRVAPFKKGPDYIDPAWLGAAADAPARTLDSFLTAPQTLLDTFASARGADLAIIEGNRGLFDGLDASGTHSTAELAKHLQAPVVLVVDVGKSTRTVAALVLGCLALDAELPLGGIILNRVASPRQEQVIREALAQVTWVPVLGSLSKQMRDPLPARHLGLVLPGDRGDPRACVDAIADVVELAVDLSAIRSLAREAPSLAFGQATTVARKSPSATVRIGVLRDEAFSFYYPENLAALEAEGAEIIPISPIRDTRLPPIDALYAGGGYPELHASALAANTELRAALARRIGEGLPVWAECGGLMYLAAGLHHEGQCYPMVGALSVDIEQTNRPQGHGYVEATIDTCNAFLPIGTTVRGHEFHYSRITTRGAAPPTAMVLHRGVGLGARRDGLVVGRVFASYTHIFAPGVPAWAPALIRAAREARAQALSAHSRGGHRGIHDHRRNTNRDRRGRLHSRASQVE